MTASGDAKKSAEIFITYLLQVERDGRPFFPRGEPMFVEMPAGAALQVLLPPGCPSDMVPAAMNGSGRQQEFEIKKEDPLGARMFEWRTTREDAGACEVTTGGFTFRFVLICKDRCREELSMLTVMPRCLGPLSEWKERLEQHASSAGYTAVHLTPCQKLGLSMSAYSLYDPLELAEEIGGLDWSKLTTKVLQLQNELNLEFHTDLVVNHLASDSPVFEKNPGFGYNTENCPWLSAASELDLLISQFSDQLVDGCFRSEFGLTKKIENEGDLNSLVLAFESKVILAFRVLEFFDIDSGSWETMKTNFCEFRKSHENRVSQIGLALVGRLENGQMLTIKEALRWSIGIRRRGMMIYGDLLPVISNLPDNASEFERQVRQAKDELLNEGLEVEQSIRNALIGTVRYERIVQGNHIVKKCDGGRLLSNYFTTVVDLQGGTNRLACNGWVVDHDCAKDFADPGSFTYLGRRLMAWGDSNKLNYGRSREMNPGLWDLMVEYVSKTAAVFCGVRMDNCHSTPRTVAKYLLQKARQVRPDIFVLAELFTNDPKTDADFCKALGINALVREAHYTRTPESLGQLPTHHGAKTSHDLGIERHSELFTPHNLAGPNGMLPRAIVTGPLPFMLYDQTHDNQSLAALGQAGLSAYVTYSALTAFSPSACGSTVGTDILCDYHLSVVEERRLLPTKIKDEAARIEVWFPGAKDVQIASSWTDWKSSSMTKTESGSWVQECEGRTSGEFKFIVDGEWRTNEKLFTVKDDAGCENHRLGTSKLGLGIQPLRKVLLDLKRGAMKDCLRYDFISGDETLLHVRRSDGISRAFHLFLITGMNSEGQSGCRRINVPGNLRRRHVGASLVETLFPRSGAGGTDRFIGGLPEGSYCLALNVDHDGLGNWARQYSENDVEVNLDKMKCGTIFILEVEIPDEVEAKSQFVKTCQTNYDKCQDSQFEQFLGEATVLVNEVVSHSGGLESLGYLLFSDENEEQDISFGRRGGYHFHGLEPRFSGISSPLKILDNAVGSPNCKNNVAVKNLGEGDWLLGYLSQRLIDRPLLADIKLWMERNFERVKKTSIFGHRAPMTYSILRALWEAVKTAICSDTLDPLRVALEISALSYYLHVPSSPLEHNLYTPSPSICAGHPHFSSGLMRAWGRDTFIALPGVLLCLGRVAEAKTEILGFAKTMRHGQIPNLLGSGKSSRHNARDATFFFLRAVRLVCQTLNSECAKQFLETSVPLNYPDGNSGLVPKPYEAPKVLTLQELIHFILSCQYLGISYREFGAGRKIDENMTNEGFDVKITLDKNSGLPMGGNIWNCGTWMDKMGSSEKAGNKGKPATPRCGTPIEIGGILAATLKWILSLGGFPKSPQGAKESYSLWEARVSKSLDGAFWNEGGGFYNDTYGATSVETCRDDQLRCNWPIAVCEAPWAFDSERVTKSLRTTFEKLMTKTSLGVKTLDPSDENYRPAYDNGDDGQDRTTAHGWNYHQGPEWVWPVGFLFQAAAKSSKEGSNEVWERLQQHRSYIQKSDSLGLPELTQAAGAECRGACWSQAWSLTLLEFMEDEKRSREELRSCN